MTGIVRPIFARLLVALALICGMATSGFAHRLGPPTLDAGLLAYLEAGGAFADLCGDPDDPLHPSGQVCEACRLIGAAVLPSTTDSATKVDLGNARHLTATDHSEHRSFIRDPSWGARAPPRA
ncbi:hypothetical protein [Aliiroseovarius sp. YM-037]|uniref:hypothetical protein n=1 Tax=Aliiroseovarius sp. YM-037 TaxID=3341728 RepID=UPI003A80E7C8